MFCKQWTSCICPLHYTQFCHSSPLVLQLPLSSFLLYCIIITEKDHTEWVLCLSSDLKWIICSVKYHPLHCISLYWFAFLSRVTSLALGKVCHIPKLSLRVLTDCTKPEGKTSLLCQLVITVSHPLEHQGGTILSWLDTQMSGSVTTILAWLALQQSTSGGPIIAPLLVLSVRLFMRQMCTVSSKLT